MGNDEEKNVSPHNLIKADAYEWVVKWRTIFLRGPESAGGATSVGGLQIIVSGLESGGVGPKMGRKMMDKPWEKTESGGQSFKSDKK